MADLFVLLPAHLDARRYFDEFRRGKSADSSPWGFAHAEKFGHTVSFSPGRATGLFERAVRRIVGFELCHAWVNRKSLVSADVILTHTEREYLAAAFVLRLFSARRPILQGNTLWLFDEWKKSPFWRRGLTRFFLRRIDVLTCNATPNVERGRSLGFFPVRYIPYGISTDSFPVAEPRTRSGNLIASIGNDRSRNWRDVQVVATKCPDIRIRVASPSALSVFDGVANIEVRAADGVSEVVEILDRARLSLVCVSENCHASGITVVLEAVARGTPVVCAAEGGLAAYFDDDELWFYGEAREHKTAVEAVSACLANADLAKRRAQRAQDRFLKDGYDSVSFIRRLLAVTIPVFESRRGARGEASTGSVTGSPPIADVDAIPFRNDAEKIALGR